MKLFKYNQFLDLKPMNENVQKSKSYLKEFYLVGLAAKELGFITEEMEYELKEGARRVFLMKDFTPEQQQQIRNKIKGRGEFEGKGIRLTDEDVRKIESNPDFKKVRELKVETKDAEGKVKATYQLDRTNPNWVSNFVYFYFAENMSMEQLASIYERLIDYRDYLDKLPKKFDLNFIDETIPNEAHNHTNGEDLSDELDKLKKYRQFNKIKETLPSHLKKALESASELQMEELYEIAAGFDEFRPESKRELVWKNFFGDMQEDRQPTLPDGKPNPHFGKVRYMSRLGLIKTLNDFIKSAKGHLQGSTTSGYTARLEKINKTSDKFGVKGANIVYNENGIMVVQVHSYAANNFLNQGDCSHCIVDRGQNYWDSYVGDSNNQYYVYNFNIPNTNPLWAIGVTIRPDRTWQSGACQNARNTYIGGEFKSILKNWQKEYNLNADILNDVLNPISKEELDRRQRQKLADREIVKKGISVEQIQKLVKEDGADINRDNCIALINAVDENNIEKINLILSLGGNPNLKSGTDAAISKAKSLEVIKILVAAGSSLTNEVFMNVKNDLDAVEYCLKAGLDPNFNQNFPIRKACEGSYKSPTDPGEGNLELFKLLLKYGAVLFDGGRNRFLKWAAEYGRVELMKYAEEFGAAKDFTSNDYTSAIQWISHSKRLPAELKEKTVDYLQQKADEIKAKGK